MNLSINIVLLTIIKNLGNKESLEKDLIDILLEVIENRLNILYNELSENLNGELLETDVIKVEELKKRNLLLNLTSKLQTLSKKYLISDDIIKKQGSLLIQILNENISIDKEEITQYVDQLLKNKSEILIQHEYNELIGLLRKD